MKITHDKNADALYITLRKGAVVHTSKLKGHIIVDTDKEGTIIGIEVLNASTHIANKKPLKFTVTIPALV